MEGLIQSLLSFFFLEREKKGANGFSAQVRYLWLKVDVKQLIIGIKFIRGHGRLYIRSTSGLLVLSSSYVVHWSFYW